MTDREKLISMIKGAVGGCPGYWVGLIVDHLLDKGVTFATDTKVGDKWISVDDRLPENDAKVLVCDTREDYVSSWVYFGDGLWFGEEVVWTTKDITHWMPLPEPPKEN
jgi:hypothetical protein